MVDSTEAVTPVVQGAAPLPDKEDPSTFEKIKAEFDRLDIPYRLTTHEPVLTS